MNEVQALQQWGPYAFGVALLVIVWRVVVVPVMNSIVTANASNLAACKAAESAAAACKEAAEICRAAAVAIDNATNTAERLFTATTRKETHT